MKRIRMFKNWVYVLFWGMISLMSLSGSLGLSYTIDEPMSSDILPLLIIFYCISAIMFILWIVVSVNFIVIDSNGIKVTYFNKVVVSISWDEIANIEDEYQFRNSLYKVGLFNGKTYSFIQNKKFKLGVITFGNDRLKRIMKNL
ncbi:MAG: hypothetical protein K2H06_03890 [Anaeroplasmataceae bacterium]|nr:hypothetical protein [Anaeroplasmataceae bacterium]